MSKEWIGVDLDGTLAVQLRPYSPANIGEPIAPMVARVKRWLEEGQDVRIFTARVAEEDDTLRSLIINAIGLWTKMHIGRTLPVTNVKDYDMVALYDDRAVQVERDTGKLVGAEISTEAFGGRGEDHVARELRPRHLVIESPTGFAVCTHCGARAGLPRRFDKALEDFVMRHAACPAPSPEVCEHAVLKRSCDRCAMAEEVQMLRAAVVFVRERLAERVARCRERRVPIDAKDADMLRILERAEAGDHEAVAARVEAAADIAKARGET